MLTILVSTRKQKIITDDGRRMHVRRTYVRHKKKLLVLQQCESFKDVDTVRIVVKKWCCLKRLPRHEKLQRAIVEFLHQYHAKQDIRFDCYVFANLMYGVEPHRCTYLEKFWKTEPFRKPEVGEVVFLISPQDTYTQFHHAAIYIGQGLYISVWGAGGDLEVATLSDMKKGYKAEKVLLGTPRA